MHSRAEQLFTEVCKALRQMLENKSSAESLDGVKAPEYWHHIAELEVMLEKEKEEFEVNDCDLCLSFSVPLYL